MADLPIYVSGPSITQKELDYVKAAVETAWYGNANIFHERFEKAFADYIEVKYAIALPSCTSAIHLALLAAGVGKGDEVIVPDITWIASAAPVSYVGAEPVFVDIDPRSWCMTAEAFKAAITPKTKAVIPVDLYGNIPDMDEICAIAKQHGIFVLEDAAEAIGSEYKGCKAGSLGDVGVFSFHGSKTMTTGEGGMLVTDDQDIYEKALFFRDHGRSSCGKMFWNDEVGYKYKMSSMQAALGLAQLERIEELVEKKRQIFECYRRNLGNIKGLTLNFEAPYIKNSYWMVTVILDSAFGFSKEQLIDAMKAYNISIRPFFYPLTSLPAYAELSSTVQAKQNNKYAYAISPCGVNLPCGMDMTEEKIERVCQKLIDIIA